MSGMQVPTVPVRIVGDNTLRYGPANLGAVDACFLVVDDYQQVRECLPLVRCRHD